MPVVRQRWLDLALNSGKKLSLAEAKPHVRRLYSLAGLPAPIVIVVDSPLAAQYAANILSNGQVSGQKMEWFPWFWYGLGGAAGWVSFYDAFREMGIVKSDNFDRFVEFLKLGVWEAVLLRGYAILCSPPSAVHLDRPDLDAGLRRLHRLDGPAVEWHDGYRGYWVAGVRMEPEVFEKSETLTVERILGERNAELRKGLIHLMGVGRFLELTDAKALHQDFDAAGMPRTLYALDVGSSIKWALVGVECPSKRDDHWLWVDPRFATGPFVAATLNGDNATYHQTCHDAVAWTFQQSPASYRPKVEA